MKNLTPLNAKPSQILHEIKDKKMLERPDKMRSAPSKRDKNLWCRYHNDHGHTTDNCESLKHAIEALIKRGHLPRYVNRGDKMREATPLAGREGAQEMRVSSIQSGGGNCSWRFVWAGAKGLLKGSVYHRWTIDREVKTEPVPTISFSKEDVGDTKMSHDDPLVITLPVCNFDMKRILVENRSSTEVLFYEAFQKMNIPLDRLHKIDTPLYGFFNHPVFYEGIIALPVAIAYNAILGQTVLNQLKVVVLTYHMKMKFPTEYGVGEVKEDQAVARQCYMASCRANNNETLVIEDLRDETKIKKGKPVEDLLDFELYSRDKENTVRIGTGLTEDLKLIDLMRSYSDIFAWTAFDMPGIDPEVITHKMNAGKLRPYFQSQSIIVLTNQPLGKVLQNPEASGRLVNWSVELGKFDIKYKPRAAIKAQALSDFIVECTMREDPPRLVLFETSDPWLLYVDGCYKIDGGGAGLMLISPEKFVIEYAIRFDFQASNNEAEYEALLAGIRLAHSLKVDSLSAHSDSQLVVNQILGEYEARDERMI
ncbi:hypothetical protein RJ639_040923 [Escallonia herrerae]|uniref:RNase H type-1 domain-containing protein n=1 Tax=Escallonia herrerae TaxID=1293975 RepID=A0AA89BBY2_9ASTE|nr:hypothetical protein RJ639_040923 [Escallonia herrerae]